MAPRAIEKRVQRTVLHTDMNENILYDVRRLSDGALLARLAVLALGEREATVEVIGHLAELDARRAHLGEGPGSVSAYCRDVLGYSEDAAWSRAATANVVRRFPVVLGWLADGSLNLTVVRMLRPVLASGDPLAVLEEARRRTKSEVELIVRRLDPRPDVPSTIRKVPPATVTQPLLLQPETEDNPSPVAAQLPPRPAPALRPIVAPLTPERYRVEFTVSKETRDKLRRVQDLLCREIRNGDPAAIFDRALDVLLEKVEKKKLAATAKPRPAQGSARRSRYIPADIRRTVSLRDQGRCAFVGPRGRCSATRFLEWHHVQPFADQGPPTVENISLRCRAHNVYESERVFGPFDASTARARAEMYRVSREYTPFRNGGSEGEPGDDSVSYPTSTQRGVSPGPGSPTSSSCGRNPALYRIDAHPATR
jgi:hypothetical protein